MSTEPNGSAFFRVVASAELVVEAEIAGRELVALAEECKTARRNLDELRKRTEAARERYHELQRKAVDAIFGDPIPWHIGST